MAINILYLAALPQIQFNPAHIAHVSWGTVTQSLTLYPSKEFATHFFPDEADKYILIFSNSAAQWLVGGHVTGYTCFKEYPDDGRVIVRVEQHVA